MTARTLEQRYRKLLRVYPKEYRDDRGEEIVATYMEFAEPGRDKPSVRDVDDVVRAGLRQRFKLAPDGMRRGFGLAAAVTLSLAVAAAAGFTVLVELAPLPARQGFVGWGPFHSPAVVLWAMWMVIGAGAPFLSARAARFALAVPLAAAVLLDPLADLMNDPFAANTAWPTVQAMAPMMVLGVFSLAWPKNPSRATRAAPAVTLVCAAVALTPWLATGPAPAGYEDLLWTMSWLPALALVVAAAVLAVTRGGYGGGWAFAVLLVPAAAIGARFLGATAGLRSLGDEGFVVSSNELIQAMALFGGLALLMLAVTYLVALIRQRRVRG